MILEFILAILVGVLIGTLTGITPGIHINLVAVILLSFSAYLLSFSIITPIILVIFIVSMAILILLLTLYQAFFYHLQPAL